MTHDGDHRRTWQQFVLGVAFGGLLEEGVGVVQLRSECLVAHFLDEDHRGFLVELLVDGDHLAQLHQLLDDLGGLHAHLVGQIGDADGFRHVHLLHLLLDRSDKGRHRPIAAFAATPPTRSAPAGAGATGRCVIASLQATLLGRVVGPAGRQLFRLDRLLVAWLRCRRARRAGWCGRLVDGALDAFLAGLDRLRRLLGLLRVQHLLRRGHHRADRRGLVLSGLAALGQVERPLLVLVDHVGGLDDAQLRLRRLGGGGGRGRRCGGLCRLTHFGWRCGLEAGSRGNGGLLGFGLGLGAGGGFGRLPVGTLLLVAQPLALGQFGLLLAQQRGLGLRLVFETHQLGGVDLRRLGNRGRSRRRRRLVALDEGALLADLDLDGARLAAGISLLDFAGRFPRQRDLLALGTGRAVGGTQVIEQPLLVGVGQGIVRRRLADPCRLQLIEQCSSGAVQLGGELGDGGHGHCGILASGLAAQRVGMRWTGAQAALKW